MALFVNPVRALFGSTMVEMQQTYHRARYAERDLQNEAKSIFREQGKELKDEKKLKRDMAKGLAEGIAADERDEIHLTEKIREQLNHSISDLIMIAHWQIQLLRKLLKDDIELLKKHFPQHSGEELKAMVEQELQKYEQTLGRARDLFAGA